MMYGMPFPLFAAGAVPPPLVWIDSQSVSGVTEVDIAWGDQAFEQVFLLCDDIVPSLDNVSLVLRTSSDNGATFDALSTDYQTATHREAGATGYFSQGGAARFQFAPSAGENAGYTLDIAAYASFLTVIDQPSDDSLKTVVQSIGGYRASTLASIVTLWQHGYRDAQERVNAVRYLNNIGTFSGNFQAWGLVL